MFKQATQRRVLRTTSACLLTVAGLVAAALPARAGDRSAGREPVTAMQARLTGALASGSRSAEPLRAAVEGALGRLESGGCAAVLRDFTDQLGRPLTARLEELGMSPSEFAQLVRFTPGYEESPCRERGQAFAYTTPGCPVVRVCRPLLTLARSRPELAQAVVIHEILHSLGLSEGPPSSSEITARVTARCFGDQG
jgi:hypothetical protein